jgi:hypothetical protein
VQRFILSMLLIAGLALMVSGCKPRTVKVTGRILQDGQAIRFTPTDSTKEPPEGTSPTPNMYPTLFFIAEEGGKRYSATIDMATGAYSVEMPEGRYRATVFIPPKDPSKPGSAPPPTGGPAGGEVYEFKAPSATIDIPVPK